MVKPVRRARYLTIRSPATGPNDRDQRRQERKSALLEAAVEVIRRDGPGVSMDQMAAEAGVTKPILYRHFHDRAGLVRAIAEYAFAEIATGLDEALHTDGTPRQLVAATIDVYLRFIESDNSLYRFLVHRTIAETTDPNAVLTDYISRAGRQVALVLGEGLRAAGLDSGPAEPWAFGIVGMVHSAGDWWIETGTMPRLRLADYLTTLVYDGIPDMGAAGITRTWMPTDTTGLVPDPPNRPSDESASADITPLNRTTRRSS